MSEQLKRWAISVDIGKDGKKDGKEFDSLKRKLLQDAKLLWNMKQEGKLKEAEYNSYAIKLKSILEKNKAERNSLEDIYDRESKAIINEASSKSKNLFESITGSKALSNISSEKAAREEIKEAAKNKVVMIMAFDKERGNYAMELKDFEEELKHRGLKNINSRALAEYFKYLIDHKQLNLQYFRYNFGENILLEVARHWGKGDEEKLTQSKKYLGKGNLQLVDRLLDEEIRSRIKNYENTFQALKSLKSRKMTTVDLLIACEKVASRGNKNINEQQIIELLGFSKGEKLKKTDTASVLASAAKDSGNRGGSAASELGIINNSEGLGGKTPLQVLRYYSPKIKTGSFSKKELDSLSKLPDYHKEDYDKKVDNVLIILKKHNADPKALHYFELFKQSKQAFIAWDNSQRLSKNERFLDASTTSLNKNNSLGVTNAKKLAKGTTNIFSQDRQIQHDEESFTKIARRFDSFRGYKSILELLKNGHEHDLQKLKSELIKKKHLDKDEKRLLDLLTARERDCIKVKKLSIACHANISEKKIEEAIDNGYIRLGNYWESDDATLSKNKEVISEMKKVSKEREEAKDKKERKDDPVNETTKEKEKTKAPYTREFTSSGYASIPENFSSRNDRMLFFNSMFSAVEEKKHMLVKMPGGITFSLSKNEGEDSYTVEYGGKNGIKHEGLSRKEVRNSLSFAQYSHKMGLDFLVPDARNIINAINENSEGEKLFERDGMDRNEKELYLSKIGPLLIPGYIDKPGLEAKEHQFQNIRSRSAEIAKKDPKMKEHREFHNVEDLAKWLFPNEGGNEFDPAKFLTSLKKSVIHT